MKKTLLQYITIAAAIARVEGSSIAQTQKLLANTMAGFQPPKQLKGIGPLDEWGSHTVESWPREYRAFSIYGAAMATTPQQFVNIMVQCGVSDLLVQKSAGPAPVGWDAGQLWNRFILPLEHLNGISRAGIPQYAKVDHVNGIQPLFARIRTRAVTLPELDAIAAEL